MALFSGKKFFVSGRVPHKKAIVDQIQREGGGITQFDHKADFQIYDHLFLKDIPDGGSNCYSYKLVEDAVKTGSFDEILITRNRLQKQGATKAKGPNQAPRIAKTGATGSRAAYTPEDDAILAAHVSGQTYQSGNAIYQQLEALHPHHTWQSWRDRWVKKLSKLDDTQLRYLIRLAQEAPGRPGSNEQKPSRKSPPPRVDHSPLRPAPAPQPARPPPASKPTHHPPPSQTTRPPLPSQTSRPLPSRPTVPSSSQISRPLPTSEPARSQLVPPPALPPLASQTPHRAPAPQASSAPSPPQDFDFSQIPVRDDEPKSGERVVPESFSKHDDRVLELFVRQWVESGANWKAEKIYREFALKNPHHHWKSWSDRFRDLWRGRKIDMKDWNSGPRDTRPSNVQQVAPPPSTVPTAAQPTSRTIRETRRNRRIFRDEDWNPNSNRDNFIRPLAAGDEVIMLDDASPEEMFYQFVRSWLRKLLEKDGNAVPEVAKSYKTAGGYEFRLWDLFQALGTHLDPPSSRFPNAAEIAWEPVAQEMDVKLDNQLREAFERLWNFILKPSIEFKLKGDSDAEPEPDVESEDDYDDQDSGGGKEGRDDIEGGEDGGARLIKDHDENISDETGLFVSQDEEHEGSLEDGNAGLDDYDAVDHKVGTAQMVGDSADKVRGRASPDLSDDPPVPSYHGEQVHRDANAGKPLGRVTHDAAPSRGAREEPAAKKRRVEPETQDFLAPEFGEDEESDDAFEPFLPRKQALTLGSSPPPPHSSPHRVAAQGLGDNGPEIIGNSSGGRITSLGQRPKESERRRSRLPFGTEALPASEGVPAPTVPAPPPIGPLRLPQTQPPRLYPTPFIIDSDKDDKNDEEAAEVISISSNDDQSDLDDENNREIKEAINDYKSKGFSENIVKEALFRTSMCVGDDMLDVLNHLKRGYGVPSTMAGVWTSSDDDDLRFVDEKMDDPTGRSDAAEQSLIARMLKGLVDKHGEENVKLRREYLEACEDEGFDTPDD